MQRLLHPSIEWVPAGRTGPAKGPRPSASGSARWSVIIHAGLGGRWLLGPDNILGGKKGLLLVQDVSAHSPSGRCWKAGLAIWGLFAASTFPLCGKGREAARRKKREKAGGFSPKRLSGLNLLKKIELKKSLWVQLKPSLGFPSSPSLEHAATVPSRGVTSCNPHALLPLKALQPEQKIKPNQFIPWISASGVSGACWQACGFLTLLHASETQEGTT